MSFSKKRLSGSSRTPQRMPGYYGSRRKRNDGRKIWLWVGLIILMIPVVVGGSWFWLHIMKDLPDIAEIENYSFKQATTITDKHGEVLYTLFEENRQYIPFEDMSEHFTHALIATEDQRFWTNPGIDRKGTLRAGLVDLSSGGKSVQGGSTITQQLIKNLMLTPEKKLERKFKEIVLAIKLNKYTKNDIKGKYNNLTSDELDRKVKEKILELYSNYIFLGNNSYGVETASRTYFDKSAADLTILEAAILAGIPQAPSRYDPYTNRALLVGELEIVDRSGTAIEITPELKNAVIDEVISKIEGTDIAFKRDDSAILDYFRGLLGFQFDWQGNTYQITYNMGRKDTVLARMYEEGYITESEFKKHFIDAFRYTFRRGKVEIQAPHFVFWIINLLEENYDPELLRKGGLTIKTTLDYDIQQLAEDSITENETSSLDAYGADNAALVYVNSHDGDILAYVGSKDYYNDEIDGQVDIVQAKRQPGSIVKPFVYTLGFLNIALTIDSPIYDIKFSIGNNTPENADGDYKGLMAIKNALAWSRNIPAIKMFFSAGGEEAVKPFFKQLGMTSLDDEWDYGYPLAIGAGEVPMLELTNAYMHLSAMGKPAEINPILEIRASDGSLLYKKQVKTQEQVVPAGVAYLIRDILSTKANFPASWVNTFTYPGINFATKSGTTNVKKDNKNYPRDGRFAAYTPSAVMLFWGGNTDGRALREDAFGGWINSPIWKTFTEKLVTGGYIQSEAVSQREVKSVSISKLTGKLSDFETPLAFVKNSLGYIQTLPNEVDTNIAKIQIDTLCNGLPNELTPPQDIDNAYFLTPTSIMPDKRDEANILEWRQTTGIEEWSEELGLPVLVEALTGDCAERYTIAELGEIALSIIQPTPGQTVTRTFSLWHQTKSPFAIKTVKLYLDDVELKSFNYNKKGNLIDISTVTIPEEIAPGTYNLKVIVIDEKGYSDNQTVEIMVQDGSTDTTPPNLMKDKVKVSKKANDRYEIVMLFSDDASTIASGKIMQGEAVVYEFTTNVAIFELAELGEVSYTISDSAGNSAEGSVALKE